MDVLKLFEESFEDGSLVTLEATVVTGFEFQALEECKEKCNPRSIVKAKGRIFFNIPKTDYEKVKTLRSVDNLYIVGGAMTKLVLKNDKEKDIEMVKGLVDEINWDRMVNSWQQLVGFEGNIFEDSSQRQAEKAVTESSAANEGAALEKNVIGPDGDGIRVQPGICVEKSTDKEADKICSDTGTSEEITVKEETGEAEEEEVEVKTSEKTPEGGDGDAGSKAEKTRTAKKEQRANKNKRETRGSKNLKGVEGQMVKFRVTCHRTGEHSFTSMEAAREFGGYLQDKFNWTVDLSHYELEVVLNIASDGAYISAALTHESMHRRNITHFGATTLRSTLCYGLLRLAAPEVGDIVMDPLCGGGSISIEGRAAYPYCYHICGDREKHALARSKGNIESLQWGKRPELLEWNATRLPLKTSSIDVAVTDLPFGKRSGRKVDNKMLYKRVLTEMGRVVTPKTGRAVLLTSDRSSLIQALNSSAKFWKSVKNFGVNQGGLSAFVFLLHRTATKSLY